MASYTVAAGLIAAHAKTLVAATVDTVDFAGNTSAVEVLSDGAAAIFFTTDGTTPTVNGGNCYVIPAGGVSSVIVPDRDFDGVVKLISSGTPTYSVTRA